MNDKILYDFRCEHCNGTVREKRIEREAIRHKGNFVILEDVPIGICDNCGARYYHVSVLRRAAEISRRPIPLQTVQVPVERYTPMP